MKKFVLLLFSLFLLIGCTKNDKIIEDNKDPYKNIDYSNENWKQKVSNKYGIKIELPNSIVFESVERKDGSIEEYNKIEIHTKITNDFKIDVNELVSYLFELTGKSSTSGNAQIDYNDKEEFIMGEKIEKYSDILSLGEEYAFADWLYGDEQNINYIRVEYEDELLTISLRKK